MKIFVCLWLLFAVSVYAQDTTKQMDEKAVRELIDREIAKSQRKVVSTYDIEGKVIHHSQHAKGWHRQFGSVVLSGGRAVVNLNVSPAEGKQDVSFIADSTYRGVAWSLDSTNTNTYWVIPLSGTQMLIKSSDNTDTVTIRFLLEGN